MYTSYLAALLKVATIVCLTEKPSEEYKKFIKRNPNYESNTKIRWTNYCTNKLIIEDFNKHNNYTFKLGPNDNMDKSYEQYLATYLAFGRRSSRKNSNPNLQYYNQTDDVYAKITYPERVDFSDLISSPIDQGHCGSCYAHATLVSMSAVHALKNNLKDVLFSVQYYLDCGLKQNFPNCLGGVAGDVVKFSNEWGLVSEKDYPYEGRIMWCRHDEMKSEGKITPSPIKKFIYYEKKRVDTIKRMLIKHGPLLAPLVATDYIFQFYKGGIIDRQCEFEDENHYVNIVGYDKTEDGIEYWIVRNSMGSSWGENGHFRIKAGLNLCKIEDHVIAIPANASRQLACSMAVFFMTLFTYFVLY